MPKLRIAYASTPSSDPVTGTTLDVTSVATAGGARPAVPSLSGDHAVYTTFIASDAPIYVDVGTAPDPTGTSADLILPGRVVARSLAPGMLISAVVASDIVLETGPIVLTNRSGTVTLGGAAQEACAANTARKFLVLSNPSETLVLWVSAVGAAASAAAGSIRLAAGETIVFDKLAPTGAISVFGATTGQPFTVHEG